MTYYYCQTYSNNYKFEANSIEEVINVHEFDLGGILKHNLRVKNKQDKTFSSTLLEQKQ